MNFWQFFLSIYVFYFGAAVGSFLDVVAIRLPKHRSLLGRSQCEFCHRQIPWYDLFPIFSYFVLKGHCRFCQKRISSTHLFFEIITGTVMVLWFHKTGFAPPFQAFIILLIAFLALALALSDYYYQIIPDQFLIGLIILGLLLNYQSIITFIPGVLVGTVAFYLLHALFSGQALGFGDVKYVFTMGLILPWPHLIMAIYLAFLTGGIVSVILILAGKKGLKSTISFGPFLTFGLLAGLWQII